MYTRYYDGYTRRNEVASVDTSSEPNEPPCEVTATEDSKNSEIQVSSALPFDLPFGLKADDIILIAVLFLIASESGDDFILPLILGYLLLSNI